jgi:DNA-binding transcriptional MerR regulator
MTSRYRAAQRAVELVNQLQDAGFTVDEIAVAMRRSRVSDRQDDSDPAAELYASVKDMVADFAKVMGHLPPDAAATARAEAAEQRAEALAAEVARLRAEGFAAGINAAADALAWRAEAFAGFGHYGYAHEMREARKAVLETLAEAQPAEATNG